MKAAADESFGYTEEELVSSDIIGMSLRLSVRCDADAGTAGAARKIYEVRVVAWYDNEMSYTSQLIRTLRHMGRMGM